MPRVHRRILWPALAAASLSACAPESRITHYKPFFANITGAEFVEGGEPVNADRGYVDPTVVPDNRIVIENPDRTKTLVARSVRHMMTHLERCLDQNEDDLLLEQVISQKTKDFYRTEGRDPRELIDSLRMNRKEIARTFARMPMGEKSPTVILDQPGDKTWCVEIVGGAAKDLMYRRLWARMEQGNWKFLWLD